METETVNTLRVWENESTMVRKGTGAKRLDEPTLTSIRLGGRCASTHLGGWSPGAYSRTLSPLVSASPRAAFIGTSMGRSELLAAALSALGASAPQRRPSQGCRQSPTLVSGSSLMLEAATQPPRSRSLYAALAEAADDPIVRRVLNRVASARIEFLETCYRETRARGIRRLKRRLCSRTRHTVGFCSWRTRRRPRYPTDWSSYAEEVLQALGPAPWKSAS